MAKAEELILSFEAILPAGSLFHEATIGTSFEEAVVHAQAMAVKFGQPVCIMHNGARVPVLPDGEKPMSELLDLYRT